MLLGWWYRLSYVEGNFAYKLYLVRPVCNFDELRGIWMGRGAVKPWRHDFHGARRQSEQVEYSLRPWARFQAGGSYFTSWSNLCTSCDPCNVLDGASF